MAVNFNPNFGSVPAAFFGRRCSLKQLSGGRSLTVPQTLVCAAERGINTFSVCAAPVPLGASGFGPNPVPRAPHHHITTTLHHRRASPPSPPSTSPPPRALPPLSFLLHPPPHGSTSPEGRRGAQRPQNRRYCGSPHGRRAGGGGASWRQCQATGPPERLSRGVESGRGRREAAGRAGEGRWMEGMEGCWCGSSGRVMVRETSPMCRDHPRAIGGSARCSHELRGPVT